MFRPLTDTLLITTAVALAGAGAGCIAGPDEPGAEREEDLAEAASALSGDFTDASGTVTIRIKQCGWSASVAHPSTTCTIESDFVLVGGGAEVEGNVAPGALLTASYPNTSLTTWMASSKDHRLTYPHRLRAYAVGLKLAGISPATLRGHMRLVASQSALAQHPSTTAALPPGFKLVGGGAQTVWSRQGLLLTSSYPDGFQWVAEAKDHIVPEAGFVNAYAIGIADHIPGFGSIETYPASSSTWAPVGYGTATLTVPTGWVLASIGGSAQYDDNEGRLLTDLIPFSDGLFTTPGAVVTSKDHVAYDSGHTIAHTISIRRP